jgi:hypothetical protein
VVFFDVAPAPMARSVSLLARLLPAKEAKFLMTLDIARDVFAE